MFQVADAELDDAAGELIPGSGTDLGMRWRDAVDRPLLRVVPWEREGAGWRPTDTKVALTRDQVTAVAPPIRAGQGLEVLVSLLADWDENAPPGVSRPAGAAVKQGYERGIAAWPEGKTALSAHEWALSRVGAFLDVAGGQAAIPGYVRDFRPTAVTWQVALVVGLVGLVTLIGWWSAPPPRAHGRHRR